MPIEVYKEKLDYNKVVGTIDLGSYTLLIYPRKEGGYFLRAAKSERADFIHSQTKDLAPQTNAVFGGLDPDLLEVIEVGAVLPPQVTWRSGSGVLEEPQITVVGTDAFEFQSARATLFDNEVADLFSKPKDSKEFKSASFISINTAMGDIMGIVVRRNTPVIFLMAPSIDASSMSSKEGLNSLMSGILTGITSKLTSFEVQVFNALAEASSEEYFQVPYDNTTLGGKLQNNLLMQIYTARLYYLARTAEITGEGVNNAELIEYFPYLKNYGKKKSLGSLFNGGPKNLRIDPKVWDDLVEDSSKGINLKNPADKTPRPKVIKPLDQRGLHFKTQTIVQPGSKPAMVEPKPFPVVDKEWEEVAALSIKPIEALSGYLGSLVYINAGHIAEEDIVNSIERMNKVKAEFAQIVASKKMGRPPVSPTQVQFQAEAAKLKAFGINGEKILDFLTPTNGLDYRAIIEKATSTWITDSDYQNVSLRGDRKARLAQSLLTSNRLAGLAEHVRAVMNLRDVRMVNQGYDLVYMSYLLLAEKTIYTLEQAGNQLCLKGQTVEIINWAHYCNVVIERLIKLGADII